MRALFQKLTTRKNKKTYNRVYVTDVTQPTLVMLQFEGSQYPVRARYVAELYELMRNRMESAFFTIHGRTLRSRIPDFWLSYQGKPLPDRLILLPVYNIHERAIINVNWKLLGGKPQSRTEFHVYAKGHLALQGHGLELEQVYELMDNSILALYRQNGIRQAPPVYWLRIGEERFARSENVALSSLPQTEGIVVMHTESAFEPHGLPATPVQVRVTRDGELCHLGQFTHTAHLYLYMEQSFRRYCKLVQQDEPYFWLSIGMRPVSRRNIALSWYQDYPDQVLPVLLHCDGLRGGNPLQGAWELQAADQAQLMSVMQRKMSKENVHYIIKLVEDTALLGYQLMSSPGKGLKVAAIVSFVKQRIDGPLLDTDRLVQLQSYFDVLFNETEVQSADEFFSTAREMLDSYEQIQESAAFKKLHKFLMYALSLSLFEKAGVTFDKLRYSKMEEEGIRRRHHMGASFVHCILDTVLFITERGYQCMKTGSLDPIYHSGSAYEAWFTKVTTLQRQSKFLSNPEVHGFTESQFLMDLDDTIDQGKAIAKHALSRSEIEKRIIRKTLADLELIKATELTKRAAGRDRKAPFSVLVFGGSSVAKSAFTKMLYYHYGKLFDLPTEPEYRYVRNANDPFWSGFSTAKWCIQLDDIAYLRPDKAPQGDPSILEMLQVVNSVPFVPNQAELEDKGRTPVRARFVVATSNSPDLNSFHYFHCPLAVQRRLPYVITISPKPEFARNVVFLNPDATPEVEEGGYPNLWNIKVQKVIPQGEDIFNQQAELEEHRMFSDVYDFIAWFSQAAKKFDSEQELVERSDERMAQAEICHSCYRPKLLSGEGCKCAEVQGLASLAVGAFYSWTSFCFNFSMTLQLIQLLLRVPPFSVWLDRFVSGMAQYHMAAAYYRLGNRYQRQIGICKVFLALTLLTGSFVVYFRTYSFVSSMLGGKSKKEEKVEVETYVDRGRRYVRRTRATSSGGESVDSEMFSDNGLDIQGNQLSKAIGKAPSPAGEKENVWHNDNFKCTPFDMPVRGLSWTRWTDEELFTRLQANACCFISSFVGPDGPTKRLNRALALGGHFYLTNNHGLPADGDITLCVIFDGNHLGVSSSYVYTLRQDEIHRYPERDAALIELRGISPKPRILDLFGKEDLSGCLKGFYLNRGEAGDMTKIPVVNVLKTTASVDFLGPLNVWTGVPARETLAGECGMAMILRNGYGPFIGGLHVAYRPGQCMATSISQEFISTAVKKFGRTLIQSGLPNMEGEKRELTEVHYKSPFRYLKQGMARVYGSFTGFRPSSKSRVVKTLTHDAAVKRGYEVKTGAPCLRGWEPWYHGAVDLVNPVTGMKASVLETVKTDFLAELKVRLDPEMLQRELFVYDDITAVNGMAGVRFVDKMNRNTSMGFPWRKSKKEFLHKVPAVPNVPDPMEFDENTMDRVQKVIEAYHAGERYCPVYAGAGKDEALKHSKVKSKKTRLFMASPTDSNFVVRKYLLAFVRVLQLHSFFFESAPGVVAQNKEWEDMLNYLDQFKNNKFIAGDYAAFDKRMPAVLILAAFDIIMAVCGWSGNYTEEDFMVLAGIAEDTAFPVVDFNGDLVEFYGSMPSGHPLTVIVNGLCNCLYMRYCYAELNPAGPTSKGFKDNVALMTYGDDNVMGVSDHIPWFNHTAIQAVLASIGVTYTMADKEAESVPYITRSEISFLKRVWRYDEDLQAHVAPLDEDSIAKMLTMGIPSREVAPEAQAIDVLSTVTREYFWYGREKFEEKRLMCLSIMVECDLQDWVKTSTFPSWEELTQSWRESSESRLKKEW